MTEICFDVGFTSLGTFSRTFTDIVGEPPTDLSPASRRPQGRPGLLLDGVDETEQFWRSERGGAP